MKHTSFRDFSIAVSPQELKSSLLLEFNRARGGKIYEKETYRRVGLVSKDFRYLKQPGTEVFDTHGEPAEMPDAIEYNLQEQGEVIASLISKMEKGSHSIGNIKLWYMGPDELPYMMTEGGTPLVMGAFMDFDSKTPPPSITARQLIVLVDNYVYEDCCGQNHIVDGRQEGIYFANHIDRDYAQAVKCSHCEEGYWANTCRTVQKCGEQYCSSCFQWQDEDPAYVFPCEQPGGIKPSVLPDMERVAEWNRGIVTKCAFCGAILNDSVIFLCGNDERRGWVFVCEWHSQRIKQLHRKQGIPFENKYLPPIG